MSTPTLRPAAISLLLFACLSSQAPAEPAGPPPPDKSASEETRKLSKEEYNTMIDHMRLACSEIAARHGNPKFGFVFTNDEKTQLRLNRNAKLLAQLEPLDDMIEGRQKELASLNRQHQVLLLQLDAKRLEMGELEAQLPALRYERRTLLTQIEPMKDLVADVNALLTAYALEGSFPDPSDPLPEEDSLYPRAHAGNGVSVVNVDIAAQMEGALTGRKENGDWPEIPPIEALRLNLTAPESDTSDHRPGSTQAPRRVYLSAEVLGNR